MHPASLFFLFAYSVLSVAAEPFDIWLINITIYQDHEADRLFTTNHPEVYLSCSDGRPHVELDTVRRVKQLYAFRLGDIKATEVDEDGCVKCSLKESDSTPLLSDDTFGSWSMCQEDFAETGFHEVEEKGEFLIALHCPDCVKTASPADAPAPEPEDGSYVYYLLEPEVEAPSSGEPEGLDLEAGEIRLTDDSVYTVAEMGRTQSSERDEEENLVLQSREREETQGSSQKTSVVTVLLLCFLFLVVGIALGVFLLWKVSKGQMNKQSQALEIKGWENAFPKKNKA